MMENELEKESQNERAVSAAWLAEPERGGRTVMRLVTWLALRLGRSATRWLLFPISLYFLAFAPRARRASRTFLGRALARKAGAADVLRNFHAFAATLHDRMYLLSGRFENLDIAIDGGPQLDAILARGRGCILLGSHLGSFEALRALGRLKRYTINIVMYAGTTQRSSEVLNDLAPELKERVIAPGRPETMLRIKECLERGEIVGILGDRPFGSNKTTLCPFLGVPARFPEGPFRLAMVLEVPVVLFFGLYQGGDCYRIVLEVLADSPTAGREERSKAAARWVERYVGRLEHYARAAPYNWFNIYDFWGEGLQ
jgi:predicted LPLAT superfamily acyltransferase